MEVTDRFVLEELGNAWSVSWPGYEYVVVNNPAKAKNLLKILFDEVGITEVSLMVHQENNPKNEMTMHIDWGAWLQDQEGLARYVVDCHIVKGCKFVSQEDAEKFKLIMERRLAWRRISNRSWQ